MHYRYSIAAYASLMFALVCAVPVFANESEVGADTSTASTVSQTGSTTLPAPSFRTHERRFDVDAFIREWRTRHSSSTSATGTEAVGGARRIRNVNASCVQKAVDTREVAIQAAWTAFNTSINTALVARQTALYEAWGASTTERTSALKTAWGTWKDAHKAAFKTLKSARNATWKTYKTTMSTECKVNVPGEERLMSDTSGSVSL